MESSTQDQPYDVLVGIVVGAHGVRGELRVAPETDFPERFGELRRIYLSPPRGEARLLEVAGARVHPGKSLVFLRLAGVDDREAALALRGSRLYIREGDLAPLPPGRYYEFQILGLRVVTEDGRDLGPVTDIVRTGANDVYETPQALIPVIEPVIREVDLEQGRIVVRWIEGMEKS